MTDWDPAQRRAPQVRWGIWAALAICTLFVAVQAGGLDYGTTVNNLPHVARYQIKDPAAAATALQRRNLILDKSSFAESLDKRMLRFKLYSVEADEVVSIMALARMRPADLRLDPGFYLYGGAWFYPLGAWYFALREVGAIELGPLAAMAAAPDRMDGVYIAGRLFVLIAAALSGFVFFLAARRLVPSGSACLMLGLYFAAPATVAFSQMIKPHWYAMLFVNLAVLIVLRGYLDRKFGWLAAALTGFALGLAVGAVQTFGLFAILVWVALALAARRGFVAWPLLIAVPVTALLVFVVTNPYAVINWETYVTERSKVTSEWFTFALHPKYLWRFVAGSLLPGLGIGLTVLALAVSAWRLVAGAALERWTAAGLILSVLVVGYVTASLSQWHINLRYAPYLLSAGLLFVGFNLGARRNIWLGLCLALTLLQSVPMWLAYRDEDSVAHSTRMRAARWLDSTLKAGAGVRVDTAHPSPYEVPPFDFTRIHLNLPGWQYHVRVERQPRWVTIPADTKLVARFRPRVTTHWFPLVYGHINPQISIYQRR